ncbi:MAG: hypothetical protein ACOVN9_03800 [Inhella sp.]
MNPTLRTRFAQPFQPLGLTVLLVALGLQACGGGSGDGGSPPPPALIERNFDFGQGAATWVAGSADYSPSTAPNDVIAEPRALPSPFTGTGYLQSGTNRSDDLFLFVKTPITGMVPGTTYRVSATVEFLSDVPTGCAGVGGSPGESVWVVLAASTSEPVTTLTAGEFRLNIDRGNQSQGGASGLVLGTVANSVPNCGPRRWESKTLKTPTAPALTVTADTRGAIWVLLGFDSGFEASSRLYYRRLNLTFQPT